MSGSIWRAVTRETEKAYLIEVHVNNRRDGSKIIYKWVAKSVCEGVEEVEGFGKFVLVPEHIIGNGVW